MFLYQKTVSLWQHIAAVLKTNLNQTNTPVTLKVLCQATILQDRRPDSHQKTHTFSKVAADFSSCLVSRSSQLQTTLCHYELIAKTNKKPKPNKQKHTHTHTSLENFWKNSINVLYAQIYCKFICDPLPTCNRQLKVWRVKFKQTFTQADKLTNILTANRPS